MNEMMNEDARADAFGALCVELYGDREDVSYEELAEASAMLDAKEAGFANADDYLNAVDELDWNGVPNPRKVLYLRNFLPPNLTTTCPIYRGEGDEVVGEMRNFGARTEEVRLGRGWRIGYVFYDASAEMFDDVEFDEATMTIGDPDMALDFEGEEFDLNYLFEVGAL